MKHFPLTAPSAAPLAQSQRALGLCASSSSQIFWLASAGRALVEALGRMETPRYRLSRLRIEKFKSQPARGWAIAALAQPQAGTGQCSASLTDSPVLLPGSHAAALQAKPAHHPAQAPAIPQLGITTSGGSYKKPPQLLLRSDNATNQQQSPHRPREEPGKKRMPCHPQANMVFPFLRLHSWELHKPRKHGGGPCSTSRSHGTSLTKTSPYLREVHTCTHRAAHQGTGAAPPRAPALLAPRAVGSQLAAACPHATSLLEGPAQLRTPLTPRC